MTETKIEGIVTRGHGNRFVVCAAGRYYTCQLRGRVKFKTEQTTPVAVGDEVEISLLDETEGVIEEVRPRRSVLSRPAVGQETREHVLAANVDALVIVTSVKEPAIKPGLIDRFLIAARMGGLSPAIVINKIDLGIDADIAEIIEAYRNLDYDLFLTSALEGTGLDELKEYLGRHHSILAGHSGVGKSTILNRLVSGLDLPTAEISHASGRGRHTTSRMELFHVSTDGYVIDSPGIKVLGLWQLTREDLTSFYPEMQPYLNDCRFTGCSHIHEPDCAVRQAVEEGAISRVRYQNYLQIYNSI